MPYNGGVPFRAEVLREARQRKGWTLREVSNRTEKLGRRVDHGNYAKYESGELTGALPSTLEVLAKALDVDINELVLSKGDAA